MVDINFAELEAAGARQEEEAKKLNNAVTQSERLDLEHLRDIDLEEYNFALDNPSAYAGRKAIASIVPFGWTASPSGRQEFKDSTTGQKALTLGLDLLMVPGIPGAALKGAKGLWTVSQAGKITSKLGVALRVPPKGLKSWSQIEKKVTQPFEFRTVEENLMRKYKINDLEAGALVRGEEFLGKKSDEFSKLFSKEGVVSKKVKSDLTQWRKSPIDQKRDFYKSAWRKEVGKLTGGKGTNFEGIFRTQVEKFLGREAAKKFSYETASSKLMASAWSDLLENTNKFVRMTEAGYGRWIPSMITPGRSVMATGERVWGNATRFDRLNKVFGRATEYGAEQFEKFNFRLIENGFGTVGKAGKFIPAKNFTKALQDETATLARKLDDMASTGATEEARSMALKGFSEDSQNLYLNVIQPWQDDLYREYAHYKIPQIFAEAGLSNKGRREVSQLLHEKLYNLKLDFNVGLPASSKGILGRLDELFKVDHSYKYKAQGMAEILDDVKKAMKEDWFIGDKGTALQSVGRQLSFATKGGPGYPAYLENYFSRLGRSKEGNHLRIREVLGYASGKKHGNFVKKRLLAAEAAEGGENLAATLSARASSQANDLFLYPELNKIMKEVASQPRSWRDYFEHHVARMQGIPSNADELLAGWMTRTVGGLERIVGKTGQWDSRRVMNLSNGIHDLIYLSALGFRPFSAMRNLFQPLLNVPTDLGGTKDFYWLIKGIGGATSRADREYIRSIGAIKDFTPQVGVAKGSFLQPAARRVGGVPVPTMKHVEDLGMWMFKHSDEWNRYVTGSAASRKWDHHAARLLSPEKWNPKLFARKMKFSGREAPVQDALDELIDAIPKKFVGNSLEVEQILKTAKSTFVNDVIADTQWLYGLENSPQAFTRAGVFSKGGLVFQSWWMNYLNALDKWFRRTGDPGQKLDRLVAFMGSAAIANTIMQQAMGIDEDKALRNVALGPIPDRYSIPPIFKPIWHGVQGVTSLGHLDPEGAKRAMKELGKDTFSFVPGGLALKQGLEAKDFDGFLDVIIRGQTPR